MREIMQKESFAYGSVRGNNFLAKPQCALDNFCGLNFFLRMTVIAK
jgi:hypothetical protein